jgi:predicted permease
MPADVVFPLGVELWRPLRLTARDVATQRGAHYLAVIARRRAGATLDAAQVEFRAIARQLAADYPRTNEGSTVSVHPLRTAIVSNTRPALRVLSAAVALVLLVACVNVAALALGFSLGRSRDLAIRAALGASRRRLARALFVESLLLAAAGGTVGLALAMWCARIVAAAPVSGVPLLAETRIDAIVAGFAGLVSMVAAVVFGTLPAWQATRTDLASPLRLAAGRATPDTQRQRLRAMLLVVEVAMAVALLAGAGLLGRTWLRLTAVDLGFDADRVQTMAFSMPGARYADPDVRARFVDDLLARVGALPGVAAAGATSGLPLSGFNYYLSASQRDGVTLSDGEQDRLSMQLRMASPGFFEAMGMTLVRGRTFTADDRRGAAPVIVVNERAAAMLWPGVEAIGHRLTLGSRLGLGGDRVGGEVVGVVGNVRDVSPAVDPRPTMYAAHAQFPIDFAAIAVRTGGDPGALTPALRAAAAALDPDVALSRLRPMRAYVDDVYAQPRLYLVVLAAFALAALGLAAVGVYGAMSQLVGARTREIGVRMALGATRRSVVTGLLGYAGRVGAVGVVAGGLLSLVGGQLLARLPYGVRAADAWTFAAVGSATLGIALLAGALPARRAASIDPLATLRSD